MTPRLIFLHLPRTGGTTLIHEHLFPAVAVNERCNANYNDKMESIGRDDPLAWPPERRKKIRLVVGHMPFSVAERFGDASFYATLLRDPITRTLSDYAWCRQETEHGLHSLANELSLAEFVERGYSQTRNCYTRWLSGATYGKNFETDSAMLAAAEQVIDRFSFVGITEFFDESVSRLCARFGFVRRGTRSRRQITKGGKRKVSPGELDVVRQHNALDTQLYERCREAFLAQDRAPGGLAQDGVS